MRKDWKTLMLTIIILLWTQDKLWCALASFMDRNGCNQIGKAPFMFKNRFKLKYQASMITNLGKKLQQFVCGTLRIHISPL